MKGNYCLIMNTPNYNHAYKRKHFLICYYSLCKYASVVRKRQEEK